MAKWIYCAAGILMCTLAVVFSQSGTASQLPSSANPKEGIAALVEKDDAAGLELWQTLLGKLWIPKPGNWVMPHLEWEQAIERVYHHPSVHVQPGDIVIDCGAHIGGFTRIALRSGARKIISIEPEKANIAAFRRNFAAELASGQVVLVEKGVWDTEGKLSLHLAEAGDSHSIVVAQPKKEDESIEVTTIDLIAKRLRLPKVDFIKMDIEGSENNALRGGRKTILRWHPRLAISSYHLKGDPAAISGFLWETHQDYLIESKDRVDGPGGKKVPKVLFFR
jgi:FkbM family methyltransferase